MTRPRAGRAALLAVAGTLALAAPAGAAPSGLVPLTGAPPGSNELNPRWSPSGRYLAIERDDGTSRTVEIYATDPAAAEARLVETLALRPAGGGGGFLLEAAPQGPTFNAWLSWAPDERRFVFVSNAGAGAYDLYMGALETPPAPAQVTRSTRDAPPDPAQVTRVTGGTPPEPAQLTRVTGNIPPAPGQFTQLTRDEAADGQVAWSPTGDRLAFVSGRTDYGDLYLLDLATRVVTRLTAEGRSVLHPEWSPDGRRIAFALGDGDNHDICVMEGVDALAAKGAAPAAKPGPGAHARPAAAVTRRCLVTWPFDDVRPRWSPDGTRLAFYSSYNPEGETGVWSLFAIAADGSDPARGDGLLARRLDTGVVVDLDAGPAWAPDGRRLLYAKRVDREFNPLYLAELATRATRRVETGRAIHHDVTVARDGRLALRAQVGRWDRVLVGRIGDLLAGVRPAVAAPEARR